MIVLNAVQHIVTWSQQTNLMSIPTDCDQRDEVCVCVCVMCMCGDMCVCIYPCAMCVCVCMYVCMYLMYCVHMEQTLI